jgi:hypothetical protein
VFKNVHTLLENRTFVPEQIFHLYRIFLRQVQMRVFVLDGATTRYKCPLRGTLGPPPPHLVQMPHICTGCWLRPVQMCWLHIYQAEPPPGTNVDTFVPDKKKTWYKYHSMDPADTPRKISDSPSAPPNPFVLSSLNSPHHPCLFLSSYLFLILLL